MSDPADGPEAVTACDVVLTYYQPVKARALREAVLPQARRAAAEGLEAHVERHWRYGPHLRLRLRGPSARVAVAAEQAAEQFRAWVAEHPSVADRTDEQLLAEAAVAGRVELIAPPYGPLVPDNTVRVEPVDPAAEQSLRALLGAESADLRDELLRLGLPALGSGCDFLGAHGDAPEARVQLVVAVLAAHATAHPEGLVGGHYSMVSHLEDFLVHEDPDGRLRAAFEQRWKRVGDTVTALVARITDGGAQGWERDWAHWSATAWGLAERRLAAGADLSGSRDEYRERAAALGDRTTAERWNAELRTRYSEFHQLLHRSDPDGTMWTRPDYLIYRACTNGLYRLLAICDVRPVERYLAAHLVVRSVPALTGHRWQDRVDEVIAVVEGAA
ncbi:lantibiotic dehydratase C-terminal domain-containing protein [Streptomyces sp. 1331.2]|uniref:lantibiotic dehydratase C-terminal domain-containing protein n=1 Tax=Streptomyces sp. 1331.2 TaxID=1938835 RepID=UPI000BCEF082|nr:lantibiotic dehydratase C-terminal domain-containing protein [Streptomyces sp. 1331.2]SOB86315.1 Lantibiotic biosynthesis dehydratase C-term [Streptomyces sp. 1331.2]